MTRRVCTRSIWEETHVRLDCITSFVIHMLGGNPPQLVHLSLSQPSPGCFKLAALPVPATSAAFLPPHLPNVFLAERCASPRKATALSALEVHTASLASGETKQRIQFAQGAGDVQASRAKSRIPHGSHLSKLYFATTFSKGRRAINRVMSHP